MEKLKPLSWHTEQRVVKELIPLDFNPKKLTESKKQKLIESIDKFNLVEIPVLNLDNTIIAGHQRFTVLCIQGRENEIIDVRVPNRMLTEKELKEYNLRSNISIGEWIEETLEESFSDIDFDEIGLEISVDLDETEKEIEEVESFKEEFNSVNEPPKYPLVPKYSEKHNAVIIVSDNTMDSAFLDTVLQLGKNESYKSQRIGKTNVISVKKFQELWENR